MEMVERAVACARFYFRSKGGFMNIKFHVNRQHIARTDRAYVVAGSRNFLGCEFTFTPEWAGIVKTAIFQNGDTAYHVVLENDAIAAAAMPVLSEGCWNISVFGGNLITADSAPLIVARSGYAEGTAPAAPSATVYETLSGMISQAIARRTLRRKKSRAERRWPIADGTLYIN